MSPLTCPDGVPCGQRGVIRAENGRPYCICCGRATDGHWNDGWMSRHLAFRFKMELLRLHKGHSDKAETNKTKKSKSNSGSTES